MTKNKSKLDSRVYVFKCNDGRKVFELISNQNEIRQYFQIHNAVMAVPAENDPSGVADSFQLSPKRLKDRFDSTLSLVK